MLCSAKKNKKCSPGGKQNKQKIKPEDSLNAAAVVNMNHTFFVPPDEEEKGNNIEERVEFASRSDLTHEAEFQQELKYNNNREEVYTNSSELSEVLKLLATKIGQSDSSRTVVPIESFSKVVPDFDGVSIPIRQWL